MMNPKNAYRLAFWLFTLALFGSTAYFGYRFVRQAGDSAGGIQAQVEAPKPIGNIELRASAPFSGNLGALAASAASPSSGQDVVIKNGEFAYRNGRPEILVSLHNQGGFAASAIHISLSLYLDGSDRPAARENNIYLPFAKPLAAGATLTAAVPVSQAAWTDGAVQQAGRRRVVAQIIAVSDAAFSGMDYPQLGAAVQLPQTLNHWPQPETVLIPVPDTDPEPNGVFAEAVLQPEAAPQIEMPVQTEENWKKMHEAHFGQRIDLNDDTAVSRLPRGQGIISVDVREGER